MPIRQVLQWRAVPRSCMCKDSDHFCLGASGKRDQGSSPSVVTQEVNKKFAGQRRKEAITMEVTGCFARSVILMPLPATPPHPQHLAQGREAQPPFEGQWH